MKKTFKWIALSVILAMALLALASCATPNASPEKAAEALEKAGYKAEVLDSGVLYNTYKALGGKLEAVVSGSKGLLSGEGIVILYYETADDAKDAFEAVEQFANEKADEESDFEIKQSSKMIWFGHKDAVKAAA